MAGQLNGKIAVITGGSSGIGLAAAKRFVAEGATVYITGRKQEALDAAVAAIGGNVVAVRADSSRLADLARLYSVIRERSGRVDVLYANAGIAAFVPVQGITEEHYDSLVDTNLKGTVFTVQQAVPLLSDGASIILTSSTAGYKGMEAFSIYSATKAAIRQLARSWLIDLKQKKVRVNVISPGMVDTPAIDGLAGDPATAGGMKAHFASQTPLGKIARPEDIAAVALFLASDESSHVNGADLPVDGGTGQI
ncbi:MULTISPECIES: SDR family oxidoreductase [Burkholderia]|uniref:SDR family NAD(P)-dependent oxidoreductase n=1 Tax=Burkholderia TaxID=32008 RepID=UPI00046A30BD|nr:MULTISPECIES: SDR family oxidoreductase [Burkholderia]